jgi:hypothetical protein
MIYDRPYCPAQPLPSGIVDLHCHLAGLGAGDSGCFVSPKLRKNWRFRFYLSSFGVSEEEVLSEGDSLIARRLSNRLAGSRHVRYAVALAMDGVVDSAGQLDTGRTEIFVSDKFVAEAATRHKNLLFGASVNPHRRDALDRLAWAKANGAVLIKWIPSIMEVDPADARLEPFYRKLVELNLPLLTHTGKERSFSGAADDYCDPERLRLPLGIGVTVIAAHIASTGKYKGERSTDRLARLMADFPNLYSDISSLTQLNKLSYMKEALTRPEFAGRLVYGSDFPLINTLLVSPWYYCLRLSSRRLFSISRMENVWDADVCLKQALGTPADVFSRSGQLLGR